jgi:hypothetical protein
VRRLDAERRNFEAPAQLRRSMEASFRQHITCPPAAQADGEDDEDRPEEQELRTAEADLQRRIDATRLAAYQDAVEANSHDAPPSPRSRNNAGREWT